MTQPPQAGDWYYEFYRRELDRRFDSLQSNIDTRFSSIDREIKDIKTDVQKLEDKPKDNFRAYVTPVITALITALILTYLVSQGVVSK